MPKAKKSSPVFVTARNLLATPPGILGFSSLLEADKPFKEGDQPKFKARWHYTPDAFERLIDLVTKAVFNKDLLEQFQEKFREINEKAPQPPQVVMRDYLDQKASEGNSEKFRNPLPFMTFTRPDHYKNKSGEKILAEIKAWSPDNKLLDLKSLRLGMGSTVQVVLTPGLYCSSFSDDYIAPSFRLEGVRILKLEQYASSAGPKLGELTEADKAMMEEGVEPDDLSAYVRQADKPTADHPPVIDDDEIPF